MSVKTSIESNIRKSLKTEHLEVFNESHMHSVPPNSETHFKVIVVSNEFAGKPKVARHQVIYSLVSKEMAGGVHALAIHTYTPEEWAKSHQEAPASPNCHGGTK